MKKNIALAFAALIVLGTALPTYAYVLLSPRRSWAGGSVTVLVNTAGNKTITDSSKGVANTASAIRAWTNVVSSGTTNQSAVRGDGTPYIMLNSNGKICNGSCLAATLTGYYQTVGGVTTITDADVYTNQRYSFVSTSEADGCSGEFYIEGIMVHEVGHVIGIGHSNVAGATMYPSVSSCNNGPASLEADDDAAKNDLY
ncbi:MAG: matrixin family metalloprotease [Thermoanaerobaculia bacterium]|nr:matrixin family metalloprotease [Thermoanaerobaculia bacterium]